MSRLNDYCDEYKINRCELSVTHIKLALKDFDINSTKKSYIRTICCEGSVEDFQGVLNGNVTINSTYKKIKYNSNRKFYDVIDEIVDDIIASYQSECNFDITLYGLRILFSLYKKSKLTQNEYQAILDTLILNSQEPFIRRKWLHYSNSLKKLSLSILENDSKLYAKVFA